MPHYRIVSADRPVNVPATNRDDIELLSRYLRVRSCQPTRPNADKGTPITVRVTTIDRRRRPFRSPLSGYQTGPCAGPWLRSQGRRVCNGNRDATPHYRYVSADKPLKVPGANRDEIQFLPSCLYVPGCQPTRSKAGTGTRITGWSTMTGRGKRPHRSPRSCYRLDPCVRSRPSQGTSRQGHDAALQIC